MANYIISADFAEVQTVTASATFGQYGAYNLLDYTHPYRVWKGTGLTDNVVFDFGAAVSVEAVILDNVNETSIKVQFHTADSWGTPDVDDTVTPEQDPADGRYKIYHTPTGAAISKRYARIVGNGAGTSTGEGVLSIGSVAFLTAKRTLGHNPEVPITITSITPGIVNGLDEAIVTGNRFVELNFTGKVNPALSTTIADGGAGSETMEVTTWKWLGEYNIATPLALYLNDTNDSEVYICHRVADSPVQKFISHYRVNSMTFREYR